MILLRGTMALIFGLGALVMVAGATVAWLYVIAAACTQIHAVAGAAVFVGSLLAWRRWSDLLAAPWQMWMGLWAGFDDRLKAMSREGREGHAQGKSRALVPVGRLRDQ